MDFSHEHSLVIPFHEHITKSLFESPLTYERISAHNQLSLQLSFRYDYNNKRVPLFSVTHFSVTKTTKL